MQDSSTNNAPTSTVGMFLCFSLATNVMQFFLGNDGIRTLEAELLKKDQTISQVVAEKNVCEGKFIGFTQGRR